MTKNRFINFLFLITFSNILFSHDNGEKDLNQILSNYDAAHLQSITDNELNQH